MLRYNTGVKQILSAKLKLKTSPEQLQALRATSLAYRDGLNAVSRYAYAHGKTSSNQTLHRGMYAELRATYHLPSQLACSVERQVAATYQGLWTKVKKNAESHKAGMTKKRYKGLDQPPKFVSPTAQYTYERDYTFKTHQRVSLNTLEGRITLAYQGYERHVALLHHGASMGDAKLWYDQHKKRFYLLVSLEVEMADPTFESHKEVVGSEFITCRARVGAPREPGQL
jgi:putative transposase